MTSSLTSVVNSTSSGEPKSSVLEGGLVLQMLTKIRVERSVCIDFLSQEVTDDEC